MTSKGLGEMFEGDSALQTCAPEKFPLMLMGDKRTVKRAQTVSEDPHRRERKFCSFFLSLFRLIANSPRRGYRMVLKFCMGS